MRAVQASSLRLESLVEVWNAAYAGYFVPMSWDVAQLQRHLRAGSIDLERSLVWLEGDEPVALSLLGTRQDFWRGVGGSMDGFMPRRQESPRGRGWIGGFGIVPSHRGRGLATGLLREQLDVATASGIRRVQLEVLTQNWAARSYERAGFVTTRRLSVLQGTIGATIAAAADPPGAKWLDAVDVPHLAGELDRLHADYPAAWTRAPETLDLEHGKVRCLVIGPLDQPSGILLSKERAGVAHVVDAAALDEEAAGWVVSALAQEHAGLQSRLVNEPDGSPLVGAFTAAGVREVMAQYEMHWHR